MTWIARCTTWCAACGGYLLYAGQVKSIHELITATVLASAAMYWALSIRRCGHRRFALSLSHVGEWAKAVISLGPAIVKTLPVFAKAALLGGSPGRLVDMPFQRGHENDAADNARRASAVLIASLGPDNYVVRVRPEHDHVLMHMMLSENISRDPCWLNS